MNTNEREAVEKQAEIDRLKAELERACKILNRLCQWDKDYPKHMIHSYHSEERLDQLIVESRELLAHQKGQQ